MTKSRGRSGDDVDVGNQRNDYFDENENDSKQ